MSEQWEPKADDFRQVWAAFNGYGGLVDRPRSVSMNEGYAEFDRWLEQVRAAARREDLAATLVWPYGRKPGRDGAHRIGGRTIRPAGVYVEMDGYEMRPETAVDLARALLAAAEAATSD